MIQDKIEAILGDREVDAFVDCVGFEAHACGCDHHQESPAVVPKLCHADDLARVDKLASQVFTLLKTLVQQTARAQQGSLSMRFGLGWAKFSFTSYGSMSRYEVSPPAECKPSCFDKIDIAKSGERADDISGSSTNKVTPDFDGGAREEIRY